MNQHLSSRTPGARPRRRRLWPAAIWFGCFLLSIHALRAQQPGTPNQPKRPSTQADIPRSQNPTPPPVPPQLNDHFAGHWTGVLERSDAIANSPDAPHTRVSADLSMRPSPDGRAVNLEFTYLGKPDGATADNHERTIIAFTADTALVTGTATAQNQAFHVQGLDAFGPTGYGTLVLTGSGKQNDKPVDIRETLTLEPGEFTWLKQTRPAGSSAPFTFSDRYQFTRTAASVSAPVP